MLKQRWIVVTSPRRPIVRALLLAAVLASAALLSCAPASAPASPTSAPAAKSSPAAPSAVATSQSTAAALPTAAPKAAATQATAAQPKIDYPAKGKPITLIVPWPAGGGTDLPGRLLASGLEKELGTSIAVLNKPGAASQVGITELARANPDGYTLAYSTMVPVLASYLDPEKQTSYSRKNLQPVSNHSIETGAVYVPSGSPFKDMKDLIDAAKAKPEQVKAGTPGIMSLGHLEVVQIEKATGVKFAMVQFDGSAQMNPALLGGHIDAAVSNIADCIGPVREGRMRVLAVFGPRVPLLPDVASAEEQGFKVQNDTLFGMVAPAGVPREIINALDSSIKKVVDSDDHKKQMGAMFRQVHYLNSADFNKWWDERDAQLKELIPLVKQR